jgi:hypothetical protein
VKEPTKEFFGAELSTWAAWTGSAFLSSPRVVGLTGSCTGDTSAGTGDFGERSFVTGLSQARQDAEHTVRAGRRRKEGRSLPILPRQAVPDTQAALRSSGALRAVSRQSHSLFAML